MTPYQENQVLGAASSLSVTGHGISYGFQAAIFHEVGDQWRPYAIFQSVRGAIRFYDRYSDKGHVLVVLEHGKLVIEAGMPPGARPDE